ncbi:hypothetical protein J6590_092029, partial [Homalodisca vitripennis]
PCAYNFRPAPIVEGGTRLSFPLVLSEQASSITALSVTVALFQVCQPCNDLPVVLFDNILAQASGRWVLIEYS